MLRKRFFSLISGKWVGILIPALLGFLSLILIYPFPYLRFTFQLFSLICGYWIVFYLVFLLRNCRKFKAISRIIMGCMICFVVFLLVLFVFVQINIVSHHKGDAVVPTSVEYVIVLGCQVVGEEPSAMLEERLIVALDYMQKHPESIAVLTGYKGVDGNLSEAKAMEKWLTDRGIGPDRLILDERSEDTAANIHNSLKLLRERDPDLENVIVVSNGFHLFRAKKLCEWEGCTAYGVAGSMPGGPVFSLNWYLREFASVFFMYGEKIFA